MIMTSWISIKKDSDFSIYNIPFGIIKKKDGITAVATRLGDTVIDIAALFETGMLNEFKIEKKILSENNLNSFIALGKSITVPFRKKIQDLFDSKNEINKSKIEALHCLLNISEVENLLPVKIGDYTDFYSSRQHATNVGIMFRDPANALLPNWKHIPVGYHGRASSIVVSGTPFHRPKGQRKGPNDEFPSFGVTNQLDFELEMAFIVSKETKLGESVSTAKAEEHIFGFTLFNDWSARDIQSWEYVPLGPFLAKNFCSGMSPWIVTLEALESFKTEGEVQEPKVLNYLAFEGNKNLDIKLEVLIATEQNEENLISQSNYKYMYWNYAQQLAHHTVNGCNINVGDVMASGTISGETPDSFGSMLELTWRGTKPLKMKDGSERKFINDGDTVIMRGYGLKDGVRVGFGEVSNKVLSCL